MVALPDNASAEGRNMIEFAFVGQEGDHIDFRVRFLEELSVEFKKILIAEGHGRVARIDGQHTGGESLIALFQPVSAMKRQRTIGLG